MRISKLGYILAVSMFAICLQACNKEKAEPEEAAYPILFGSYDTRSTANLDNLKNDGFKVYAYLEGNTGNNTTFDRVVTYNSTQNVWSYEGLQYWIPETSYWFKAFYPSTLTAGTYNISNTTSAQNYTITGLDITKQEDVMVASASTSVPTGALSPATGSVVYLQFQHIMSNVTIKVKSQVDGVTIQKITLGGVATNATYNGSVWNSSNTTSIVYNTPTTLIKGADYVDVTSGGILVIPEQATNKQLTVVANKTYNVTIPAGTWESGKKYTYTLLIKQDDIVFVDNAPYVEVWDSENATGSVIIK